MQVSSDAALKLIPAAVPLRDSYILPQEQRKTAKEQRETWLFFRSPTGGGRGFPPGTRSRWLITCRKNSKNSENAMPRMTSTAAFVHLMNTSERRLSWIPPKSSMEGQRPL